ncbi:hypothetical protein CEXT_808291 [Caerostris extrusa]|uniref:Uncharacterized protein n=1 Tax=Caerostris extrusa TaxID=172846 RepID=A0AAV4N9V2_CAEEX|nr:hypothetical protein CEXT_808291 [Caerostris extrusa]
MPLEMKQSLSSFMANVYGKKCEASSRQDVILTLKVVLVFMAMLPGLQCSDIVSGGSNLSLQNAVRAKVFDNLD